MHSLSNKNEYPKEVLEIHNEFKVASEQILEKANDILRTHVTHEMIKAKRLKALGFSQAKGIETLQPFNLLGSSSKDEEVQEQIKINHEIWKAEKIQYYHRTYPNYKFITDDQVAIICKKYNLVIGYVNRYKGFVPEANLQAIERFKIKDEDAAQIRVLFGEEISDSDRRYRYAFSPIYTDQIELVKAPLKICAPITDMDMTNIKLAEGYKMEQIKIVLDPIVLQAVDYGYLVITAWGNEASDEIIVNPNHN